MYYSIVIILSIFILLIGHHEHVRYTHAYSDCLSQRASDNELLMRDVCFNHEDRILFKNTVDCDGAERRMRVHPVACALQKWILESNVAEMFHQMTSSYWRLLLVIMIPLLFSMWLWKSHITEVAVVDRMGTIMGKMKDGAKRKRIKFQNDTAVCYK